MLLSGQDQSSQQDVFSHLLYWMLRRRYATPFAVELEHGLTRLVLVEIYARGICFDFEVDIRFEKDITLES